MRVESKKVSKNWTLVHPSFFQVVKTFSSGTFRYGPLNSVSVVGTANEEVGGYFPDFLTRLEANPFLQKVSVYYYSYLLIEKVLPLTLGIVADITVADITSDKCRFNLRVFITSKFIKQTLFHVL